MSSHDLSPLLRYPLLLPHILKLCVRHHATPAIIVHANPKLPYGGLPFGEKDKIFSLFSGVLPYNLVPAEGSLADRLTICTEFAHVHGFPVIIKPNIGHRGVDVHRADGPDDLRAILERQTWDFLIQRFSHLRNEYGIFFSQLPGSDEGHIISLTQKNIPYLTGDGKSSIRELIDSSDIHNKLAVSRSMSHSLGSVPAEGEEIQTLVGASHAAGSMYYNVAHLETPELLRRLNEICRIDGFYFGRLDVKAANGSSLQQGDFEIVEINGSTSECIHVYDSKVPFLRGMAILKMQWRELFTIAAAHRGEGEKIGLAAMIRRYRDFYHATKTATGKLW